MFTFRYFLCSPLFGEDEPNLTHIFQMGWNHQPVKVEHLFDWKGLGFLAEIFNFQPRIFDDDLFWLVSVMALALSVSA